MQPVARYVFSINDRVKLSEQGKRRFGRALGTGTIVGFGRGPTTVRVLADGTNQISNYHLVYWERIRAEPSSVPPKF
jgi:hypothetical protein